MTINKIFKSISVEPALFSASLAIYLYSIIASQYIYYRIAKDYGVDTTSDDGSCSLPTNATTNETEILERVSAETSDWILYTNLAGLYLFVFYQGKQCLQFTYRTIMIYVL